MKAKSKSPNYILCLKPNQFPAARLGNVASLKDSLDNNTADDNGETSEQYEQLKDRFNQTASSGAQGAQGSHKWGTC